MDDAVVPEDGFGEHRGDVVAVFLEHLVGGFLVVERHGQGVLGEALGDAGAGWDRVVALALDQRGLLCPW